MNEPRNRTTIVSARGIMGFSESICGICEQRPTIYGIARARNRSDGGGFARIDSGRRRPPPRNTHNVMLSPPQSLFFAFKAIYLRFKPLSSCVDRWYGHGGVGCYGVDWGRVVCMYSRKLFAMYMDCDMYRKRVIFDICRKKWQKHLEITKILSTFACRK